MRIMIVENEIRIREGLRKLIRKMSNQYEVVGEACNGVEGVELAKTLKPELIITDIRMPQMDGLAMLQAIRDLKIHTKAIVLSAYSDFNYAKEAISLGVSEYLIKPIMISDLSKALNHIEMQYNEEALNNPESIHSLESIMSGLLFGEVVLDEQLKHFLKETYQLSVEEPIGEVVFYLGEGFHEVKKRVKRHLKGVLDARGHFKYCLIESEKECMLLVFLYNCSRMKEEERWFRNQFFAQKNVYVPNGTCGGWMVIPSLASIKEYHQRLGQYLEWSIILGSDVMISYPQITKMQTVPCVYPIDIEKRMKLALCSDDHHGVAEAAAMFMEHFYTRKLYEPKEVKESVIRFLWSSISIAKEIGRLNPELNQQQLLESITRAKTYDELKEQVTTFYNRLYRPEVSEALDESITVAKARRMIHEFYQTGITLDEIADRLQVTPEYLGTQFHREVGINFSHYIKACRLKKAKELLISTPLKMYEIARNVGYMDAKYFSRVFREEAGMLPSEYRKLYQ